MDFRRFGLLDSFERLLIFKFSGLFLEVCGEGLVQFPFDLRKMVFQFRETYLQRRCDFFVFAHVLLYPFAF